VIADGFYADPMAVRDLALEGEYQRHSWRPEICCNEEYFPPNSHDAELMQVLARLVNRDIEYDAKVQGFFRVLTAQGWDELLTGPIQVHVDGYDWSGIVGLGPENSAYSIPLYRHRESGRTHIDRCEAFDGVFRRDTADLARWEQVDQIEVRFNRLVLFCPRYFHRVAPGFGRNLREAKLVQQLQFCVA
jgi:hypothetical protein